MGFCNSVSCSTNDGDDELYDLACNAAGTHCYFVGAFKSTKLTISPVVMNNAAAGSYDAYIARFEPSSGSTNWGRNFGGSLDDIATSVVVDSGGFPYFTGGFKSSSISCQNSCSGTSLLNNNNQVTPGTSDIFLYKMALRAGENIIWRKSYGGNGDDMANSLVLDSTTSLTPNMYLTGYYTSSTALGLALTFGTSSLSTLGGRDIFVAKMDSTGTAQWGVSYGGSSGDDEGNAITIDTSGNIYITGSFKSTSIDMGSTCGTLTNAGNNYADVIIAKLDGSTGACKWAKAYGTSSGDDIGLSISVDSIGNVYVSGVFKSSSMVIGSMTLTNAGGEDGFMIRLDGDGNVYGACKYYLPNYLLGILAS